MTPAEWDAYRSLWGPLVAALLLAIVDWVAVGAGGRWGLRVERAAKPAVILALLVAAVGAHAWTPAANATRPWLVLALLASLAGDVLLLPPGRFTPGLAAFLVAQLAYAAAFLQVPGQPAWLVVGVLVVVALVVTVGQRLVRAAAGRGMAGPVTAYVGAICLMAVAATRTGSGAAILGAWLVAASDAMLGWRMLVAPTSRVAVMVTYHLGQILLVLALLTP